MSVTQVASSLARGSDTDETLTITLGAAIAAGDTIDLNIADKSESVTIVSVADSVNGAWGAALVGPENSPAGTIRHWRYAFEGSAAGTPAITVTFSGSASAEGTAVGLHGSSGTPIVDVIGTTYITPGATESEANTANVAATAEGMLVGGCVSTVYQGSAPTFDNGNESSGPASTADGRSFHFFETVSGAGNVSFAANFGSATRAIISQITYIEASAGGSIVPLLNHLRQMKQ